MQDLKTKTIWKQKHDCENQWVKRRRKKMKELVCILTVYAFTVASFLPQLIVLLVRRNQFKKKSGKKNFTYCKVTKIKHMWENMWFSRTTRSFWVLLLLLTFFFIFFCRFQPVVCEGNMTILCIRGRLYRWYRVFG